MTYQVLARKWRPRSFKEMAGQGHVLKTLINALDNERLHHAYLFTGTRGVGKTTIARILARCLNCERGVSSEPCGVCPSCREIEEGRFVDLIEVDAASRTKVEDTRELLDNVQYAPTRGRYKVYLIDEVHMLSGHSFNALLKTLEEPPPHVKFLLATTDPQKLPVTVLSRCLQFSLKNLSPELLMQHMKYILEQENIGFEEAALWQLGRAARGSARDALTLLDQAISFCEGGITDAEVSSFLGTIDQDILHRLVDALAAEDAAALLAIINDAAERAPDFASVLEELLSYLHRVAIAQILPEGIDNSQGDRVRVLEHAAALPAENVQLYYQIALKGREELPLATDYRAGIEMLLLRMLAFTPHGVPNLPQRALAAAGKAVGVGQEAKAPAAVPADSQPAEKKKPLISEEAPSGPLAAAPAVNLTPAASGAVGEEVAAVSEVCKETGSNEPQTRAAITLADFDGSQWISLFQALPLAGIARNIAANCVPESVQGKQVSLLLDESQAAIYNDEYRHRIESALSGYFGESIELAIRPGIISTETPAIWRERKRRERQEAAVSSFTADPLVRAVVERFRGEIMLDSIEPLTPEEY